MLWYALSGEHQFYLQHSRWLVGTNTCLRYVGHHLWLYDKYQINSLYNFIDINCLFLFQAYLIGCSFDSFSSSWKDRTYVFTLLIIAWVVPLVIIFLTHLSILHHVRSANIRNLCIKKFPCRLLRRCRCSHRNVIETGQELNSCVNSNCLPRVIQRVCWTPTHIYIYIYI